MFAGMSAADKGRGRVANFLMGTSPPGGGRDADRRDFYSPRQVGSGLVMGHDLGRCT